MMSWNLAKKLKNSHLSSWSSASKRDSEGDGERDRTPAVAKDEKTSIDGLIEGPIVRTTKPGILIVTLHEGQGLSVPESYRNSIASHPQPSRQGGGKGSKRSRSPTSGADPSASHLGHLPSGHRPYAVLDFDNVQVVVHPTGGTPESPSWAGAINRHQFDVSRITPLTVRLYIRNPNDSSQLGRGRDIFIGYARVNMCFDEPCEEIRWAEVQHGTGTLRLSLQYDEPQAAKLSIKDFELLKLVGKGTFGKVMQVRKKDTNRIYALKTVQKAKIISLAEVEHTLAERSILGEVNSPFIVPLKFSFQSPGKLYFVLAFVNGGELFYHLNREQRFDINRSRFYAAELVCALECLHGLGVIYRDLKPENIMLDYQGHIALCDFGLCKLDMKDEDQTHTFCGTPEYLAPEVLLQRGTSKAVDWWTLGVLIFEMLTGLPPFFDENTNVMYQKITTTPLRFPGKDVVPPVAQDLLAKLLNRNPSERLGANGAAEVKAHPFFYSIDWKKLLQRKYEPAFKPNVLDARDTANFDPVFTSEEAHDSYVNDPVLSGTMQDRFAGFSYTRSADGLSAAGGSI